MRNRCGILASILKRAELVIPAESETENFLFSQGKTGYCWLSSVLYTHMGNAVTVSAGLANTALGTLGVSGGEPTMHPDFCKIVKYILEKGMKLTILSNGERFSDEKYVDAFLNIVDVNSVKIITTIHSDTAEQHEAANQTKGSFQRTVRGLLNLSENGM